MWGCHFFITLSSITFTLCVGKVKFPLLPFFLQSFELVMQDPQPNLYRTICIFLIHSGKVQKMLTALLS